MQCGGSNPPIFYPITRSGSKSLIAEEPMSAHKTILIINPGSTSTKIGILSAGTMIVNESVKHDDAELRKFPTIWDQ